MLTPRQRFLESITTIISGHAAGELFDLLNAIAVLRYEASANSGLLLLCRPQSRRDLLSLHFESPFSLKDVRGVRKMLQVSDPHLCLLSDGREVHGFTTVAADHPDTRIVQFHPHGMWELKHAGSVIVQIDTGESAAASGRLDREYFTATARGVFGGSSTAEYDTLWSLISMAARQTRGTNLLISAYAAAEADRLATQCTRIKPLMLTPALIERITSIDGTVILDPTGVCYAMGAILDGPATERGDRTRGGRYNSAVMYVDNSSFPSLIVVVSQDGAIDLVYRHGFGAYR